MQKKKITRGKLSKLDRAYAAGYVDADGCITISRSQNRYHNQLRPTHNLVITITGIDEVITTCFQEWFGGSVHTKSSKHGASCYLPHHRVQYRWEQSGNAALETLILLEPYLLGKRHQAQLGIKFQKEKQKDWAEFRGKAVPEDIWEKRESQYLQMRQLKADTGETLASYRSRRD